MKPKNKLATIIAVSIVIAAVLFIGGLFAQLMRNYALWQQAGGTLSSGNSPALPSASLGAVLRALFSFPYGLYGILLTAALIAAVLFFVLRVGRDTSGSYDNDRNFQYSDKGTYGTSGFMTVAERKQVLDLEEICKTKGVIVGAMDGKALSIPPDTRMNRNIMVYGASGSMKSRAYVRNRIFQAVLAGESLIITDPKSELYNDTAIYLQEQGYEVKVFNLVNPECSDSWDCLGEIHNNDLMAQIFAQVVIQNSNDGKGDHFWDDAEQNLLKALILYVDQDYKPGSRTLAAVYDILSSEDGKMIDAIVSKLPVQHPARSCFNIFQQASDAVRAGAIIGLAGRIQTMQNKSIREITSHPEIDLTAPGKRKCAYFCITSDQDSTFEFLSSLFFNFLFQDLTRYADDHCPGGKLTVPVHIIGDELMNAGKIINLGRRLSVIRSRSLSISVIVQNLGQIQNRYPDNEWIEVVGNCDTTLFLGCTDDLTAKFISDRSGDVTIGYETEARMYSSMQLSRWTPEYRQTKSIGKRKLLTQDEVLRLPLDRELIILRGQKVLEADKCDFTMHPHSKLLKSCSAADHVPAWRSSRYQQSVPEPINTDAPKPVKRKTTPDKPLEIKSPHQLW